LTYVYLLAHGVEYEGERPLSVHPTTGQAQEEGATYFAAYWADRVKRGFAPDPDDDPAELKWEPTPITEDHFQAPCEMYEGLLYADEYLKITRVELKG
jgi:hypothetical protein